MNVMLKEKEFEGWVLTHPIVVSSWNKLVDRLSSTRCLCCNRRLNQLDELESYKLNPQKQLLRIDHLYFLIVPRECVCGFQSPLYFVVNNLLLDEGKDECDLVLDEVSHFDRQEIARIVHPLQVVEEKFDLECRCLRGKVLRHQDRLEESYEIFRTLNEDYPEQWSVMFELALSEDLWQLPLAACKHYRECIELQPLSREAWYNLGRVLHRLGQKEEARFCFIRHYRLQGITEETKRMFGENDFKSDINNLQFNGAKSNTEREILARRQGMFGEITVVQTETIRSLQIEQQVQGGMWLEVASDINGRKDRCDVYPSSPYVTGCLLAGCYQSSAHGLVLGLGAGVGVIGLLQNFSSMKLTVIEIDPVMIETALEYFPVLSEFVRQGRLRIVQGDAVSYVLENDPEIKFDFTFVDIYVGEAKVVKEILLPEFIEKLVSISDLILVNCVCCLGDALSEELITLFTHCGAPITKIYPIGTILSENNESRNWILSNKVIEQGAFTPYAGDDSFLASAYRIDVKFMLNHAISVSSKSEGRH